MTIRTEEQARVAEELFLLLHHRIHFLRVCDAPEIPKYQTAASGHLA